MNAQDSYIYLASPYSDPNPLVREVRYQQVASSCARLMDLGHFVYSPIVHWHDIAKTYSLPKDHEYWKELDECMMRAARALYVLRIPGWDNSKGVYEEVRFATELRIPVEYIDL